jgi:hypothetical protein
MRKLIFDFRNFSKVPKKCKTALRYPKENNAGRKEEGTDSSNREKKHETVKAEKTIQAMYV